MEFSAWIHQSDKPEINGVYQGRFSTKPNEIKYYLYRNGWHAGCDTAAEAEKVIEKFNPPLNIEIRGTIKVLRFGKDADLSAAWEWRGLAEKPKGNYQFKGSDKYK